MEKKQIINISIIIQVYEVNRGCSVARNTGLECATGEYIMFIDNDDYVLPNCLKSFTDEIIKKPAIDMLDLSNKKCNFTQNKKI